MKKLTLSKDQAQAAYTIFKTARDIGGAIDELRIGSYTKVIRYAFHAGFGVSSYDRTMESYDTIEEFANTYGIK